MARSVRKAADAEALAAELGDFFSPLVFDVTDPKAIAAAAAEVRSRIKGRPLLGLVNNAGAQQPMCTLHLNLACALRGERAGKRGLAPLVPGHLGCSEAYTPAASSRAAS